jgi:hypothetical protein
LLILAFINAFVQSEENKFYPSAAAREKIMCALVALKTGLAHLYLSKFTPSSWL